MFVETCCNVAAYAPLPEKSSDFRHERDGLKSFDPIIEAEGGIGAENVNSSEFWNSAVYLRVPDTSKYDERLKISDCEKGIEPTKTSLGRSGDVSRCGALSARLFVAPSGDDAANEFDSVKSPEDVNSGVGVIDGNGESDSVGECDAVGVDVTGG
jgi:hypothetical protein